ncbi:MAG: hypothetical protein AAF684_00270 [Pseudomonadota bacterium]
MKNAIRLTLGVLAFAAASAQAQTATVRADSGVRLDAALRGGALAVDRSAVAAVVRSARATRADISVAPAVDASLRLRAAKIAHANLPDSVGLTPLRAAGIAIREADSVSVDLRGDGLLRFRAPAARLPGGVSAVATRKGLIQFKTELAALDARVTDELVTAAVNNDGVVAAATARVENGTVVLAAPRPPPQRSPRSISARGSTS